MPQLQSSDYRRLTAGDTCPKCETGKLEQCQTGDPGCLHCRNEKCDFARPPTRAARKRASIAAEPDVPLKLDRTQIAASVREMRYLYLSARHITPKTGTALGDPLTAPVAAWTNPIGAFLYVDLAIDRDRWPDLAAIFQLAHAHGLWWVRLDNDASLIPQLPIYER